MQPNMIWSWNVCVALINKVCQPHYTIVSLIMWRNPVCLFTCFRVNMCLCSKTSLHAKSFIWDISHEDSFWNRGTRQLENGLMDIELSNTSSQELTGLTGMLALRNIRAAVSSSHKVFDADAKFHPFLNNLEACQKLKIPTSFLFFSLSRMFNHLFMRCFPSYLLCNGLVFFITGKWLGL